MRNKFHRICKSQYFENPRKISFFDGDCHLVVTTFGAELKIKKNSNVLTNCMIENIYNISLLCKQVHSKSPFP